MANLEPSVHFRFRNVQREFLTNRFKKNLTCNSEELEVREDEIENQFKKFDEKMEVK